jgi:hypothetical protein
MNIDENALAQSILSGKTDLLKIFVKVKQNWPQWVCSVVLEETSPGKDG